MEQRSEGLYLKPDEVEKVVKTLTEGASTKDLAEALGRSEAEVVEVVKSMRSDHKEETRLSELDEAKRERDELRQEIAGLKDQQGFGHRGFLRPIAPIGSRQHKMVVLLVIGSILFMLFAREYLLDAKRAGDQPVPTVETPLPDAR
jgi:hypothetical protein